MRTGSGRRSKGVERVFRFLASLEIGLAIPLLALFGSSNGHGDSATPSFSVRSEIIHSNRDVFLRFEHRLRSVFGKICRLKWKSHASQAGIIRKRFCVGV